MTDRVTSALAHAKAIGADDVREMVLLAERIRLDAAEQNDGAGEALDEMNAHLARASTRARDLVGDQANHELAARARRKAAALDLARLDRAVSKEIDELCGFVPVPTFFRRIDKSRQVRAIISHVESNIRGDVFRPEGLRLKEDYLRAGGVCFGHDESAPIAWCLSIDVFDDRIEALAQFPPKGLSAKADSIFERIRSGEITGASMGSMVAPENTRPERDGRTVHRWFIREWSFVQEPAQKLARVVAIAGKSVGGKPAGLSPADKLAEARRALAWAPTAAHFVDATRRLQELEIRQRWFH